MLPTIRVEYDQSGKPFPAVVEIDATGAVHLKRPKSLSTALRFQCPIVTKTRVPMRMIVTPEKVTLGYVPVVNDSEPVVYLQPYLTREFYSGIGSAFDPDQENVRFRTTPEILKAILPEAEVYLDVDFDHKSSVRGVTPLFLFHHTTHPPFTVTFRRGEVVQISTAHVPVYWSHVVGRYRAVLCEMFLNTVSEFTVVVPDKLTSKPFEVGDQVFVRFCSRLVKLHVHSTAAHRLFAATDEESLTILGLQTEKPSRAQKKASPPRITADVKYVSTTDMCVFDGKVGSAAVQKIAEAAPSSWYMGMRSQDKWILHGASPPPERVTYAWCSFVVPGHIFSAALVIDPDTHVTTCEVYNTACMFYFPVVEDMLSRAQEVLGVKLEWDWTVNDFFFSLPRALKDTFYTVDNDDAPCYNIQEAEPFGYCQTWQLFFPYIRCVKKFSLTRLRNALRRWTPLQRLEQITAFIDVMRGTTPYTDPLQAFLRNTQEAHSMINRLARFAWVSEHKRLEELRTFLSQHGVATLTTYSAARLPISTNPFIATAVRMAQGKLPFSTLPPGDLRPRLYAGLTATSSTTRLPEDIVKLGPMMLYDPFGATTAYDKYGRLQKRQRVRSSGDSD